MNKKTFSADEILWAFLENADDAKRSISVSVAGAPWGYVRIKGPGGAHQVVVERYNATVALAEIHSALPGAEKRPDPPVDIKNHPLGTSSGPSVGPFHWAITAESLRKHYASPSEFVKAVVDACTKAGTAW